MYKYTQSINNKANLSAFLCNSWVKMGEAMLDKGFCIALGGGFEDALKTVKITRSRCQILAELACDH